MIPSSSIPNSGLPIRPRNPITHFKAHACARCEWKPCIQFRLGGVREGKWEIVHHSEGGGGDCPFNVTSSHEFRSILDSAGFNDLYFTVTDIIGKLAPGERLGANPEHFFTSFLDSSRRVDFLVRLWDDGIVNVLYVPTNFRLLPRLRRWLIGDATGGGIATRKKSDYLGGEALTDELAQEMPGEKKPLKITDIAWRHTDDGVAAESPDGASPGDVVELGAAFENYVEGAGVDFFVLGNVAGVKKKLTKVHTRCKESKAAAQWTVDISTCDNDAPGIEFYCEARSLKSKVIPIKITEPCTGGMCIHFGDGNQNIVPDVTVTLKAGDEEIFNETISDGVLSIRGIHEGDFVLDCIAGNHTFSRKIEWYAGDGPYPVQHITLDKSS